MKTDLMTLQLDQKESFYQFLAEIIKHRIIYLQSELEFEPENQEKSVELENILEILKLLGLESWIIPF